jgi:hypothetical protein
MDSDPKVPKNNIDESSDSESEEEGWIDMLADTIIDNKNWETREEEILKFLLYWLDVTISNKKGKKDVRKLKNALHELKDHVEIMRNKMGKAKEMDEMEVEKISDRAEAEYIEFINKRGDVYISEEDDDFSDSEEKCGGKS